VKWEEKCPNYNSANKKPPEIGGSNRFSENFVGYLWDTRLKF
jgi:hypothetical protein